MLPLLGKYQCNSQVAPATADFQHAGILGESTCGAWLLLRATAMIIPVAVVFYYRPLVLLKITVLGSGPFFATNLRPPISVFQVVPYSII